MLPETNLSFDLNLLPALKVLLAEKHITRAAERLGIKQSTMSKMLDKMRSAFNDPLLIRKNNAYHLSPVACRLQQSLERVMPSISAIINHDKFCIETSKRTFNITSTDFGAFVVIPHLVNSMSTTECKINIVPWSKTVFDSLQSGEIDIAFWPFPAPEEFCSRFLLRSGLKCLVNGRMYPEKTKFTLEEYISGTHVNVTRSDRHESMIDTILSSKGYGRSVKARVPYFMVAAFVAAKSDCIATVPSLMAETLSVVTQTRIVEPPDELPELDYLQVWHPNMEHDDGHIWLRNQITEITKAIRQQ